MTRQTEREIIFTWTVQDIQDSGKMTDFTGREKNGGLMGVCIGGHMRMGLRMVRGSSNGRTVPPILAPGVLTKCTVAALLSGKTVGNT